MNKKILSILIAGALLLLVSFQPAYAQTTLTSTTLSSAITDTSSRTITVTSATSFSANSLLYIDQEAMVITSVSGTVISVVRGASGTKASTHPSGATIFVGVQYFFSSTGRSGSCTSTSEVVLPVLDVSTGRIYNCIASMWVSSQAQEISFGDGLAHDLKITWDGNAQDFYWGLDDSADDMVLGSGLVVGTDPLVAFPAIVTGTSGQRSIFYGNNPATAADNDESFLSFFAEDDAAAQVEIARQTWVALDVSAADDDSQIQFDAFVNNVFMQVASLGSQSATGTAVEFKLGDGGPEDTLIAFDGAAIDVHFGLDDSDDSISLGVGVVPGTTPWVVFNQDGSQAWEGDTDDAFEATVSVDDPAADYNLTLGEFSVVKDFGPTTAELITANGKFYIAIRKQRVVGISAVWTTAESTGSMDIMVERLQGTEACGSGDDLQSAAIAGTGTAETVFNATLVGTSVVSLAAGDRLCVTLTATPNEVVGIVVVVRLVPE